MKKIVALILWALVLVLLRTPVFAQEPIQAQAIRIMYTTQAGYAPDELQMIARAFKELSGIEITIDYVRYNEQYEKIVELASTYDVLALDQIWLADLASKEIIYPLNEYISKNTREDIAPEILNAFRYQGQIWAFPFLANFQLFFYNKGMLTKAGFEKPPGTLEEMVEQMMVLKQQGIVQYPWTDSWQQNEGLICEFVWLTGAFGGKLFDKDGQPIFDQAPGVKALEFMMMLLEEQLANPAILTNDEIAAKDDFISGQAAFTSNWLFQIGLLDDPDVSEIIEQGAFGPLPTSKTTEQKTVSVGGFQGIAITTNSEKKDLAWKWISFFTSPLVQRAYLFEMPIWKSVQTSKDANMLDPTMVIKRAQLQAVSNRPNIPNYMKISPILQQYIHAALEGKVSPSDALSTARTEIETLLTEITEEK